MQETKEFVECEGGDGKLNDARSKVMVRSLYLDTYQMITHFPY